MILGKRHFTQMKKVSIDLPFKHGSIILKPGTMVLEKKAEANVMFIWNFRKEFFFKNTGQR